MKFNLVSGENRYSALEVKNYIYIFLIVVLARGKVPWKIRLLQNLLTTLEV